MDDLITQLDYVLSVMDTIPIVKLENQEKFTDCARRIRLVSDIMKSAQNPDMEQTPEKEKSEVVTDG